MFTVVVRSDETRRDKTWRRMMFVSAWGYFWMSANCVATASYVLTMKFATRTMKLPKFGMVFYNNLLGERAPFKSNSGNVMSSLRCLFAFR